MPVNARTCKHLKELLGEAYELARLKYKNPDGPDPSSKSKPASKAKAKAKTAKGKQRADADGDDDEDGEDGDGAAGGAKAIPELLLAAKWDLETGPDPTGWWISEKLDGVRYVASPFFSHQFHIRFLLGGGAPAAPIIPINYTPTIPQSHSPIRCIRLFAESLIVPRNQRFLRRHQDDQPARQSIHAT